jgi:peptidoglycan-associated lipoprotein
MNTSKRVLMVAAMCLLAAACTKKNVKEEGMHESGTTAPPAASTSGIGDNSAAMAGKYSPADLESDSCLRQRVVYFDFDRDTLKPEFQAIVACHAKYLRDRPQALMTLEGNADERGSREYNMGLGERRGNAVMAAVQGSGGSAGQMHVVSYGEERPVCTESNEDCWAKNRRVEIVYTAK